jgi:hypothetical protein
MIKDYLNWPHALDMGQGKLEPGYSIREDNCTLGVGDGGSSVYPPGWRMDGGVLCSRVAWTGSRCGGSVGTVEICKG